MMAKTKRKPAAREGVTIFARIPNALNARLRRVMLERQLTDTRPHLLRDVVVQALQAWLKAHSKR